jgi:hypothetical protein
LYKLIVNDFDFISTNRKQFRVYVLKASLVRIPWRCIVVVKVKESSPDFWSDRLRQVITLCMHSQRMKSRGVKPGNPEGRKLFIYSISNKTGKREQRTILLENLDFVFCSCWKANFRI